MINYFAYGSNMDEDDLNRWCKRKCLPLVKFLSVSPSKLDGYKLVFNHYSVCRKAGAANIMESGDDYVCGLLIEINKDALFTIQKKEGYPKTYDEIRVDVEKFDGAQVPSVITYKVVKSKEKPEHQPPTKEYIQLIISNAKKYNFPAEYINYLTSIENKSR